MMTSKKNYTLVSLLFETTASYENNLDTLSSLIKNTPKNSFIVASEVCLTGFDYENFSEAQVFYTKAIERLKKISFDKIIVLTLIQKKDKQVFNMLKVIHNGEVVYERAKARLFTFGGENKYFTEGEDKSFKVIEIDGIKIATLICFELRFKEMWKMCEGVDIIALPAWWGVARTKHFKSLTKSLAIMNQCYVIASDSMNKECSKKSAIISPQGKVCKNKKSSILKIEYKKKEIELMRRYINVGLAV